MRVQPGEYQILKITTPDWTKRTSPEDARSEERQTGGEETVTDLHRCKITEGVEVSMWNPEKSTFPTLITFSQSEGSCLALRELNW